MKNAILGIMMLLLSIASNGQQNTLVMRNNTGAEIKASFAYFDNTENCYISRGWRTIKPYGSNTINLDELNIGGSAIYIHASSLFKKWVGGFSFCANEGEKFSILYADQVKCLVHLNYNQVNLSNGQNEYIFNP